MRDNQMFIPTACTLAEVAVALGDRERAAVLRGRSSRTPTRIAVSGLAGISIGPVSGYVGLAAHVAGDLDGAGVAPARGGRRDRPLRHAGPRGPGPGRAGRRAAPTGTGPATPAASMAESAAAHEIADAIGLVLDT